MTSLWLVLAAVTTCGLSGLPAYLFPDSSPTGQRLSTALMLLGSAMGLAGIVAFCVESEVNSLDIAWFLPWGTFSVAIDALSAFFLFPIFLVPALGSVYALGYWRQSEHKENGRRLGLAYGLLAAGMASVVIARDGILFLIAWEMMALAAFFALTAEDSNREVRQAGLIYLIATHIGTLCLFALFVLWSGTTGSFDLVPNGAVPIETAGAIFMLGFIGFGFKAGLIPLHIWLPAAHANAPSHVSAVMSGVMLKMGIYGIIRISSLLPTGSEWWGGLVLATGAVTGIAGIAFAIGQQDIKRVLAYSSIENIGIILMGIGLAMLGRYYGHADWIVLGLGGSLLHVWNHGLFKPLLFFGAGAVVHATHTRNSEHLGGLAKRMPRLMILFSIGAVAISGLPPLNGFISEWFIYIGLLTAVGPGTAGMGLAAGGAAVALALIGTLAIVCFVRLLGTVFLGVERSELAGRAHEPGPSMLVPMIVPAVLCLFTGLFSPLLPPFLEAAAADWTQSTVTSPRLPILAPTMGISIAGLGIILFAAVLVLFVRVLGRPAKTSRKPTWDCGYAQPESRMQYTGTSFVQTIVRLFAFVLHPRKETSRIMDHFPKAGRFRITVPDLVLERLILPLSKFLMRHIPRIRFFQQGQTHMYILYVLITTILLLLSAGIGGHS